MTFSGASRKKQIKFCVLGGVFALDFTRGPLAHIFVELEWHVVLELLWLFGLGGVLLWASPDGHWLILLNFAPAESGSLSGLTGVIGLSGITSQSLGHTHKSALPSSQGVEVNSISIV